MRALDSLTVYARNSRKHSPEQIAQIAASIEEWGWTIPALVDEAGEIIAGHGRILAARLLNLEQVPVIVARGWTAEQKAAYVIADNKLAENATWDESLLAFELNTLDVGGFDIALTGFDPFDGGDGKAAKRSRVVNLGEPEYRPKFWISLRGPLADQARVLDAVKTALGKPGEIEIEIGTADQ